MASIMTKDEFSELCACLPEGAARMSFKKSIDKHNPDTLSVVELKNAFPLDEPLPFTIKQMISTSSCNLPVVDELYCGRDTVARSIADRLRGGEGCRVFSLVAGGGLGKSSLALDVARKMLDAGDLSGVCNNANTRTLQQRCDVV